MSEYARQDAAELSTESKNRFCRALADLKEAQARTPDGTLNLEPSELSLYDQYTAIHLFAGGAMIDDQGEECSHGDIAHWGAGFLPWHREYLYRFEQDLRDVSGLDVAIPYWNWSGIAANNEGEVQFADDFDPSAKLGEIFSTGFMGSENEWRDNERDEDIDSGFVDEFDGNSWFVSNVLEAIINLDQTSSVRPVTPLWRDFGGQRPDQRPDQFNHEEIVSRGDYENFASNFEGEPHASAHIWAGGHLRLMTSPFDPVFWMLHAEVDRVWEHWQRAMVESNDATWEEMFEGDWHSRTSNPPRGHRIDDGLWPWDPNVEPVPDLGDTLMADLEGLDEADLGGLEDDLDNEVLFGDFRDGDRKLEYALNPENYPYEYDSIVIPELADACIDTVFNAIRGD
jgi:tyrosinase